MRTPEAFGFVRGHQAMYRVARVCRVLDVSRSGNYDWLGRGPSQRDQARKLLFILNAMIRDGGPFAPISRLINSVWNRVADVSDLILRNGERLRSGDHHRQLVVSASRSPCGVGRADKSVSTAN